METANFPIFLYDNGFEEEVGRCFLPINAVPLFRPMSTPMPWQGQSGYLPVKNKGIRHGMICATQRQGAYATADLAVHST